jgi:hypothetical protein
LRSADSFKEFEYCAYLACCFALFLHVTKVISVHLVYVMELYVDFLVDEMEECEVVPV